MKGQGFKGSCAHGLSGQAPPMAPTKSTAPGLDRCCAPLPGRQGDPNGRAEGQRQVTTLNLQIVGIDPERDLLMLRGAVPGAAGSLILVREAVKA